MSMNDTTPEDIGIKKLGTVRRRTLSVSRESLVEMAPLRPDQPLPLAIRPAVEGLDLAAWAREHRDLLEARLREHGGVLFRGFGLESVADLERVIQAISGELLEYQDRVQPRTRMGSRIFTSTEYPPDQTIELHNESSYAFTWPLKIFFLCLTPPARGGATPIADGRRIYQRMDPAVRERLAERKIMYVRNFGDGLGISWQTAFQTEELRDLEEFCRRNLIELEWKGDGRLRTRSVRPALARHPRTGEMVWFNALISSHDSTLAPGVRETLLTEFGADGLPKNVFYGDGSLLEAETLAEVRRAVAEETVSFPWEKGDLLMLDNMLVAHGRAPYEGPRRVVVGMSDPVVLDQI